MTATNAHDASAATATSAAPTDLPGRMRGRVALITGASSGIGRSYAHALSAEGAQLVLVGRSEERLRQVADALPSPARFVAGDVADFSVSEEAVRVALAEFCRLDDVLANAGLYTGGDFVDTDPATIEQLVSVNVFGAMATVRAAVPHLIAAGTGDVLVTSSVSGHQDIHWEPVYSATKHAMQSFVHTLRRQLVGTGVRAGAVAPGVVLNELWGFAEGADGVNQKVGDRTGIRSEDVADAVLYMLTRPRHVTIRDLVILPTDQEI
ncbi:SDR family oxidoreductase [Herbiconiux sp. CPCC 205763]|uniref:SDR family oxidoreductase n=1 Tax=Herbiconiux aconitum TaxID=2970913 RepID=A0ABT2GV40_9MICO|nr:SDR family oxidoreductase [Herbiconiux aconitum]MCS5720070.1 SDR family oxidoreductase [Herbiconiux aconitum]